MPVHATAANSYLSTQQASSTDPLAGMLQRVWLRARRRKAWLDSLIQAKEGSHADCFNDPDSLDAEREWRESPEAAPWRNAIATADRWLDSDHAEPLRRLADRFQLSPEEADLLQLAVAMRLDPTLGPVYGLLHGNSHIACLTAPLAARLFPDHGTSLWNPAGNLAAWNLVASKSTHRGEAEPLAADPILAHWLAGEVIPDASIVHCLRPPLSYSLETFVPPLRLLNLLKRSLDNRLAIRLVIDGPPQSGRAAFASETLRSVGLSSLIVDTDAIEEEAWTLEVSRLHRFAVWSGLALIWRGAQLHRPWPVHVPRHPIHVLLRDPDQAILPMDQAVDHHVSVPQLSSNQKRKEWKRHCRDFEIWSESERSQLVRNYQLGSQQIRGIAAKCPTSAAEAIDLAKEATRQNLGDFGSLVECPFRWEDIVLKNQLLESLKDLAYEAQARIEFWENREARRLFPRGKSLTALFTGHPGTGKTMAAQIVAAELGLDLYRIDLARVVSKYIGETAKHLRSIFINASRMSSILLFDEADSLFSKRTDVKDSHDRHANADTGYLLQLLEDYQGLAILTTNKRGNIDPAFFRRIRYVYDFPRPGAEERLQIWTRILNALLDQHAVGRLAPTLETIATEVEVSAAQIKNATLAAIFAAKRHHTPLSPSHLLLGLERELAKDGRSIPTHLRP